MSNFLDSERWIKDRSAFEDEDNVSVVHTELTYDTLNATFFTDNLSRVSSLEEFENHQKREEINLNRAFRIFSIVICTLISSFVIFAIASGVFLMLIKINSLLVKPIFNISKKAKALTFLALAILSGISTTSVALATTISCFYIKKAKEKRNENLEEYVLD